MSRDEWDDAYKYVGWYRKIRTTQERRAAYAYPELVRARRNATNLPNAWDDINVKRLKSWKKHRKTQYHIIDME